jgi:hypothetical protein
MVSMFPRILLLACFIATAADGETSSDRFMLVCRLDNNPGGFKDASFDVNTADQTVNSKPATITDGEISTVAESEKYSIRITINRFTGSLAGTTIDKSRNVSIPTLSGECVRATERKF